MVASGITPKESVPATRKLGAEDARSLAVSASKVIVAKGKQVQTFAPGGKPGDDVIAAMLGPTGNLRAPTIVCGKTVVVGYSEESYTQVLG